LPKSLNACVGPRFCPLLLSGELPDFGADVRVQVGHPTLINPIEWDAVGGELERLLDRDALQ
jgi:hypothetical protein